MGAPDRTQLEFAAAAGRVVVTQDDDFLRLHAQGVTHAGIVYCRQQSMSAGEMLRRVILIYELMLPEEMAGNVEYL